MKTTTTLMTIAFALISVQSISQITQLELMSGPHKTDFTAFSLRPLDSAAHFSLGTLAFFQKYHSKGSTMLDEAGVQPTVYWNINKSIAVGHGLYYNSAAGFSERLSLLYGLRSPHFVLIAIPTIAHAEKTSTIDGELFLQIQLTRRLKADWKLLLSAQVMTYWSKFKKHGRSFQQVRLGLDKKSTQFGFAMDMDQYGPSPLTRTSFGVFVRKIFLSNK